MRTRGTGRPRSYTADSGCVYHYTFAGFRRIARNGEPYVEYVFNVAVDDQQPSSIAVLLAERRLREWTGKQRDLSASERYGMAKVCLKRALDRFSDRESVEDKVVPGRAEIAEVAETLGL